jgi:transcription elongation factor Elf1
MTSDRKALIRLASKMPVGDESRRVLLAELQKESADRFPSGTSDLEKYQCTLQLLDDGNSDEEPDYNWWRKAGIKTCPVCGSTKTKMVTSLSFNLYEGRARAECNNCDSSWVWEAEPTWTPLGAGGMSFGDGRNFKGKPAKGSVLGEMLPWANPAWCGGKGEFPPGTSTEKKVQCAMQLLGDPDPAAPLENDWDERWWVKAGIDTCPVCGSTKTKMTDSLRFNEYMGRAESSCSNCGSDWVWEAEPTWNAEGVAGIVWGDGRNFKGKPARGSVLADMVQYANPDNCS